MHRIKRFWGLFLLVFLIMAAGCNKEKDKLKEEVEAPAQNGVKHPEWARNANIYEVNLRQYTPEGTFAAFEAHLPRLEQLGVDILWLMPIHPIGVEGRKGTMGSYYAVKDYKGVNPEHGTLADLQHLVDAAHARGMYVILDWVANHTAWDNPMITAHPEWYKKDSTGAIIPPVPDWSDVAGLDYDAPGLADYMIDALKYWIEEVDIDGYRCDVAGMVPMSFWDRARKELDELKPVFMLAEAEGPEFHAAAFDMTYGWEFHHLMNEIAKGNRPASEIWTYMDKEHADYPADAYRLQFITNHDENSWNGTVYERMGDAAQAMMVLTATMEGTPLCYSGQEAGLDKRLAFFEKDVIDWGPHPMGTHIEKLFRLRHDYEPLHAGSAGAQMHKIDVGNPNIVAFSREKAGKKVLVTLNLSSMAQQFALPQGEDGEFRDYLKSIPKLWVAGEATTLQAWGYAVYVQE